MPAVDTICISFGNWIVAFYVVYAMATVALVAAAGVVIDWSVSKVRANRVASQAKVSRQTQVAGSRA